MEGFSVKKGLIICAGGMSSSLLAKKVSEYFASKGEEIIVEATGIGEGAQAIEDDKYDVYLVSPQTKMHYERLAKSAKNHDKSIVNIPPQAYVPIPTGIQKLATIVEENI